MPPKDISPLDSSSAKRRKHPCIVCDSGFTRLFDLQRHIAACHQQKVCHPGCRRLLETNQWKHERDVLLSRVLKTWESLICPVCLDNEFSGSYEFGRHLKGVHGYNAKGNSRGDKKGLGHSGCDERALTNGNGIGNDRVPHPAPSDPTPITLRPGPHNKVACHLLGVASQAATQYHVSLTPPTSNIGNETDRPISGNNSSVTLHNSFSDDTVNGLSVYNNFADLSSSVLGPGDCMVNNTSAAQHATPPYNLAHPSIVGINVFIQPPYDLADRSIPGNNVFVHSSSDFGDGTVNNTSTVQHAADHLPCNLAGRSVFGNGDFFPSPGGTMVGGAIYGTRSDDLADLSNFPGNGANSSSLSGDNSVWGPLVEV